ncbi:MAG: hypothetical protein LBI39_02665 [Puniceicoccales bacterium]|jgi:hypothetical protein|nr:hypothetical protein [Puniceicoccales bacterium]
MNTLFITDYGLVALGTNRMGRALRNFENVPRTNAVGATTPFYDWLGGHITSAAERTGNCFSISINVSGQTWLNFSFYVTKRDANGIATFVSLFSCYDKYR